MTGRLKRILDFFTARQDRIVETLERLVSLETPSGDRERLDSFAEYLTGLLRARCERVSVVAGERGARVRAEVGGGEKTILLLCHSDTVWPVDAENKPVLHRDGDHLYGPGVYDMKSGLCLLLYALEAIAELEIELDRRIVLLVTPDEETGSHTSQDAIEREAEGAAAVIVLEPPMQDGSIKTRRKGVGTLELEVFGREAHAGVEPELGVNAIHEMALQIGRLVEMNDPERGITVNVDLIEGGIKENVIPSRAKAMIDYRAVSSDFLREIRDRILNLEPILPDARLAVRVESERPPMEETERSRALASLAQKIAAEMGMHLGTGLSGGGSDGSFSAAIGTPTIDGLGLDGAAAHGSDERVTLSRIPFRGALIAELLLRI